MTSYPKPRLIKNPTAQWEQPERTNWLQWSAIVFAIAAVLFAATADVWAIPDGPGYSAEPEPKVSALRVSIPIAGDAR